MRLSPGNADGDGVCDGLEYFYRSDPKVAASHPPIPLLKPGRSQHGQCYIRYLSV